ncbi:hypothetical protein TSOC_011578, partial [Tetrabaena socialis]
MYKVDSVEVFALLMNALRQTDTVFFPPALWKASRRDLARALLGDVSAAGCREALEALAAKRLIGVTEREAAAAVPAALKWVAVTKAQPEWRTFRPLLRRVMDANPTPPVQVK